MAAEALALVGAVCLGIGVQVGRWSVFALMRNPLRRLARAYRDLFRDIARLWSTGRWT